MEAGTTRPVLAATLLPGCMMVGPDYKRPAQDLPADYPERPAGERRPRRCRPTGGPWYNDPTLNRTRSMPLRARAAPGNT